MTITDDLDKQEELRSTTPALTVWLSLTPEHIDGAQPRRLDLVNARHPVVKFDFGGLECATYASDPNEIADALYRLGFRIRQAVADHPDDDLTLDPSLPAAEYHRRYTARFGTEAVPS